MVYRMSAAYGLTAPLTSLVPHVKAKVHIE